MAGAESLLDTMDSFWNRKVLLGLISFAFHANKHQFQP